MAADQDCHLQILPFNLAASHWKWLLESAFSSVLCLITAVPVHVSTACLWQHQWGSPGHLWKTHKTYCSSIKKEIRVIWSGSVLTNQHRVLPISCCCVFFREPGGSWQVSNITAPPLPLSKSEVSALPCAYPPQSWGQCFILCSFTWGYSHKGWLSPETENKLKKNFK